MTSEHWTFVILITLSSTLGGVIAGGILFTGVYFMARVQANFVKEDLKEKEC